MFDYGKTNIQQYWNNNENNVINYIDTLAPVMEFTKNCTTSSFLKKSNQTANYLKKSVDYLNNITKP